MNTKWDGLWKQGESDVYAGHTIKKSDIPKYTRVLFRFNKFYKKDSNKPRFQYCFADSEGYKEHCQSIEVEDCLQSKVDELAEIMRKGNHNADEMELPSVSQENAQMLMKQAIGIIEEITGEEWNFSYLTFY